MAGTIITNFVRRRGENRLGAVCLMYERHVLTVVFPELFFGNSTVGNADGNIRRRRGSYEIRDESPDATRL